MESPWVFPLTKYLKSILTALAILSVITGLVSCTDQVQVSEPIPSPSIAIAPPTSNKIVETSPPKLIQQLKELSDIYRPQVTIISPQPDQIIPDTTIQLTLKLEDLPIFENPQYGISPHLEVILDNQPYTKIYNTDQPITLKDLTPGTHTIRVFASRPWNESYKNESAYAQTTFHILTKTFENNPSNQQPLLTYNQPIGIYGTQPILLDFYLTNAPLHLVAQENPDDAIADWRIRLTINGQSVILDKWQPLYLKGFDIGKNWVQIEFIDDKGNLINNVFNNTARLVIYDPTVKNGLSQLFEEKISLTDARSLINPKYIVTPTPTIEPTPEPTSTIESTPEPTSTIEPTPEPTPTIEATPEAILETTPESTPIIEPTPEPTPIIEPTSEPTPIIEPTPEPTPIIEPTTEAILEPTPESTPIIEPTSEAILEPTPEPTPTIEPIPQLTQTLEPNQIPQIDPNPESENNKQKETQEPTPKLEPENQPQDNSPAETPLPITQEPEGLQSIFQSLFDRYFGEEQE